MDSKKETGKNQDNNDNNANLSTNTNINTNTNTNININTNNNNNSNNNNNNNDTSNNNNNKNLFANDFELDVVNFIILNNTTNSEELRLNLIRMTNIQIMKLLQNYSNLSKPLQEVLLSYYNSLLETDTVRFHEIRKMLASHPSSNTTGSEVSYSADRGHVVNFDVKSDVEILEFFQNYASLSGCVQEELYMFYMNLLKSNPSRFLNISRFIKYKTNAFEIYPHLQQIYTDSLKIFSEAMNTSASDASSTSCSAEVTSSSILKRLKVGGSETGASSTSSTQEASPVSGSNTDVDLYPSQHESDESIINLFRNYETLSNSLRNELYAFFIDLMKTNLPRFNKLVDAIKNYTDTFVRFPHLAHIYLCRSSVANMMINTSISLTDDPNMEQASSARLDPVSYGNVSSLIGENIANIRAYTTAAGSSIIITEQESAENENQKTPSQKSEIPIRISEEIILPDNIVLPPLTPIRRCVIQPNTGISVSQNENKILSGVIFPTVVTSTSGHSGLDDLSIENLHLQVSSAPSKMNESVPITSPASSTWNPPSSLWSSYTLDRGQVSTSLPNTGISTLPLVSTSVSNAGQVRNFDNNTALLASSSINSVFVTTSNSNVLSMQRQNILKYDTLPPLTTISNKTIVTLPTSGYGNISQTITTNISTAPTVTTPKITLPSFEKTFPPLLTTVKVTPNRMSAQEVNQPSSSTNNVNLKIENGKPFPIWKNQKHHPYRKVTRRGAPAQPARANNSNAGNNLAINPMNMNFQSNVPSQRYVNLAAALTSDNSRARPSSNMRERQNAGDANTLNMIAPRECMPVQQFAPRPNLNMNFPPTLTTDPIEYNVTITRASLETPTLQIATTARTNTINQSNVGALVASSEFYSRQISPVNIPFAATNQVQVIRAVGGNISGTQPNLINNIPAHTNQQSLSISTLYPFMINATWASSQPPVINPNHGLHAVPQAGNEANPWHEQIIYPPIDIPLVDIRRNEVNRQNLQPSYSPPALPWDLSLPRARVANSPPVRVPIVFRTRRGRPRARDQQANINDRANRQHDNSGQ